MKRKAITTGWRSIAVLLLLAVAAGCTNSTTPVPPARKFADPLTLTFPRDVRALCYGGVVNDVDDIRYDALQSCPAGTKSVSILYQDSFWTPCPALQPVRITYQCMQ